MKLTLWHMCCSYKYLPCIGTNECYVIVYCSALLLKQFKIRCWRFSERKLALWCICCSYLPCIGINKCYVIGYYFISLLKQFKIIHWRFSERKLALWSMCCSYLPCTGLIDIMLLYIVLPYYWSNLRQDTEDFQKENWHCGTCYVHTYFVLELIQLY